MNSALRFWPAAGCRATRLPATAVLIDFSGSVEFAVGQAQRAIYVPLRNDLSKEQDETFTVQLHSPAGARLGKASTATATIRDDD